MKLSKGFRWITVSIIVLFFASMAWAEFIYAPQYAYKGTIGTSTKPWRQVHTQDIYQYNGVFQKKDSSGNVDAYVPADRVVYITTPSQLSTWTGQAATAGQSYFQCSPSTTYVIDPHAIATYGCAPGGTTAMGTFSGVSAILPDASTYSGPAYDVTVILATTGATGYAVALTGCTGVEVWPYPGTGATSYNADATTTPQTLATIYTTNGTTSTHDVTSGVSYWEIDRLNENATFGLEDSSVSAFVKNRNIVN